MGNLHLHFIVKMKRVTELLYDKHWLFILVMDPYYKMDKIKLSAEGEWETSDIPSGKHLHISVSGQLVKFRGWQVFCMVFFISYPFFILQKMEKQ